MNLPNKLTMVRIVLIPIFMFFYLANFVPYGKMIALAVFAIAAITDFFDGRIARKRNLVTNFGKFFDPLADKLLVLSALALVCIDHTVPVIMGAVVIMCIVGRDLVISGLRAIAASAGIIIAADKWGKYKAFVIDIALVLLIVLAFINQYGFFGETAVFVYTIICWVVLCIGALLSVISCINYMVKNREVFKDR